MLWTLIAILLLTGGLVLIPFGAPGTWIMLAILAVAAFNGAVGWPTLALLAAVAAAAEVLEFLFVKRYSEKYGGSRLAFWGAIAGGVAGVVIGVPVPVLGPLVAGVLGSFLGAAALTLVETREIDAAARAGWGVAIARILAVGAKTVAGVVILAVGVTALLVR
ncbi:MAG: DUF456 family protein [Gemmatimonadota bacterium]